MDILLLGIVYCLVDWVWFSKILLVSISARSVSKPYEVLVLSGTDIVRRCTWHKSGIPMSVLSRQRLFDPQVGLLQTMVIGIGKDVLVLVFDSNIFETNKR
jgi:hypothetical protein